MCISTHSYFVKNKTSAPTSCSTLSRFAKRLCLFSGLLYGELQGKNIPLSFGFTLFGRMSYTSKIVSQSVGLYWTKENGDYYFLMKELKHLQGNVTNHSVTLL